MEFTGERMVPDHNKGILMYGEHMVRYEAALAAVKNKIVLDIASGSGYGTQMLAKSAKRVYGVDISAEAVEYAKKNYNATNIEYLVGDAASIPLPDESIDTVVSFETIEHIPEYKKFLQEIRRVMKPDGVLIVSTPNDDEYPEGNEYHVHEFGIDEFKELMSGNYKNIELYYQGAYVVSGIFEKADFKNEWQKKTSVVKNVAQPAEKVAYLVAICSNGSLPKLDSMVSLAAPWSDRGHMEYVKGFENEIERLGANEQELEGRLQQLEHNIDKIRHSKSWRYTKPLRAFSHKLKGDRGNKK